MTSPLTGRSARRRAGLALAAVLALLGTVALPAGAAVADTPSPAVDADGSAPPDGSRSPAPPPRTSTSFVMGIKQDIDSLNPYVGVVASAFEAYQLMYDYLIGSSAKDFSPEPQLAESWSTSTDGKTWTYKIRQNVAWSDGEPLTAADVVYSFQRAIDGETENGQYGNYVTNITKVSAPDDHTVVMTTSEPSPSMLYLLVPILPEHVWKNVSAKQVATFPNNDRPVGSGPFQLVEAKKGQYYRFAANKSYFGGAPKIDELVFRVFADDEAMGQALRAGEIDMVQDVSASVFESLRDAKDVATSDSRYSGFTELAYNLGAATVDDKPIGDGHPALKDKRVRTAIDYAIDRRTLLDRVLRGHGELPGGVVPPIYPGWHWSPGDDERRFDLGKANQILDEAGYTKGSDGVRTMPNGGRKLELRLFGRENSDLSKRNVEYVRDWLGQIGIKVNVQIMSEDNLTVVIGQGKFDMFEWGWVVEPDPDFQLSVFTCDNRSTEDEGEVSAGWSDSFYCDESYEELYTKQKTILDVSERQTVVKQAQRKLYEDVVYSVLYYYNNFEAYRSDRFTGFVRQPNDGGSMVLQYGTFTYRNIEPVAARADEASESSDTGLWVAFGVGAVVLLGGLGTAFALRRRATADERE
ncbi:ABC transporter substrate-binding protein [Rhizomonospora bruguierae]|uniref:ABC transporter substrate-binding protein n=1 Tax=Rhizomonospora bruguierae TaxID=1581705 RepID=UPI001BCE34B8|nr:ABC transporter substrate-binding protein [Micromonospora sp. NBRC 107566]